MCIAEYTNERLDIFRTKNKNIIIPRTDTSEITLATGCLLVISYNRVPNLHDYWSTNKSLGNQMIKPAVSRNRFVTNFKIIF